VTPPANEVGIELNAAFEVGKTDIAAKRQKPRLPFLRTAPTTVPQSPSPTCSQRSPFCVLLFRGGRRQKEAEHERSGYGRQCACAAQHCERATLILYDMTSDCHGVKCSRLPLVASE